MLFVKVATTAPLFLIELTSNSSSQLERGASQSSLAGRLWRRRVWGEISLHASCPGSTAGALMFFSSSSIQRSQENEQNYIKYLFRIKISSSNLSTLPFLDHVYLAWHPTTELTLLQLLPNMGSSPYYLLVKRLPTKP